MRPTQNNVILKGSSGCGKSYFLVDWICRELLVYSDAIIITNLPLGVVPESHFKGPSFEGETFIDRIGERVGRCVKDRFVLLTEEDLEPWTAGESGPWDLDLPDKEKYLIVDEFATFCHKRHNPDLIGEWIDWFAKARHRNCWNLCVSQSDKKLPRNILPEFGERWQMSDTASKTLPGGVLEGDFNQLLSKLFNRDFAATQVIPRIDEGGTIAARASATVYRVWRRSSGYELYDSFSAPDKDSEGVARLKTWQRLSWFELLPWFASRNMFFIFKFLCILFVCSVAFSYVAKSLFYRSSKDDSLPVTTAVSDGVAVEGFTSHSISSEPMQQETIAEVGTVNGLPFSVSGRRRGLGLSLNASEDTGVRVGSRVDASDGD